jgi:monofunctional biosynthetic peptidoglycan transglycosylase
MFNKKYWPLLKKIFFWVFVAHFGWFLFFIFQTSIYEPFVGSFKQKVLVYLLVALAIGFIYYFFLRKIKVVKGVAVFLKEAFFIGYIAFVFYLLYGMVFNPPITTTQIGSLLTGNGLSRDYVSYNEMGSNIKLAVIASEDQLFPDHDGFDIKAIKMAMKYNKRHPNKVRGASTISQQTAKNIFLFQGGGFIRKAPELFFTFSIEQLWSKRKILERYLNIAEMGPGIFGVQAAAKKYFNKDAAALTRGEAAQIAACLPNPKLYTVKPLSKYVSNRYDDIVRQMNNLEGDADVQEIIK